MTRALEIAKLLTMVAICAFCLVSSDFYVRVGAVLVQLQVTMAQANASGTAAKLDTVLDSANATLQAIDRPCETRDARGNVLPCGTLADIAKTLNTARGTAGEIEIAAHHEDARIGVIDAQEAQIYADTHGALQSANDSLTQLHTDLLTANETIAGLQPVESQLTNEARELQTATASVTALIANKDLRATLKNTSQASASLAGIADDARQAVHSYFHPKWPRKVWNAVTGVGVTALRIFI